MTDHEKRASERVPVALRIRLRYQAVDQFISKFAVNISRGGMFLSSRNPKSPGTRIYFEILLADDSPVIEGNGEVRWIREYDRRRPDQPYGMGIRFVSLSEASWPLLERVIVHRRATGEYNDDEIPEPRRPRDRSDAPAPLLEESEAQLSGESDDERIARLGTVVEGERGYEDEDENAEPTRAGAGPGELVGGRGRAALGDAAPRDDEDALDTAEHRFDMEASPGDAGEDPDVIASVARPIGPPAPTNGAHAQRADDSPEDRLRRELMRALGPSVLMSQADAADAAEAGPGREPEAGPGREPKAGPGREPEAGPGREPEPRRAHEPPPRAEPAPTAEREPDRTSPRRRTAPPTEPVVRAAMRRARALTSADAGDLDRELAELLEHSAVPVEITVEAASRELAERLGGAAVQPRHPAPGPTSRHPAGPASEDDAADAGSDEPSPTPSRRKRGPAEVEPSAGDGHSARLRGK